MPLPEPVKTLHRPSARSLVFESLREWIETGELAPGETIKDVEVAKTLGVSRTPVREALQMLETLGLVETSASRHTRVAAATLEDATALYAVIGRLMQLAVEIAGPKLTSDDLDVMKEANGRLLHAARAGDSLAVMRADNEFHDVFVDRADNEYLSAHLKTLQVHARRLEAIYFSELGATEESHKEHDAIIRASKRKDFARAGDLMRANFDRTPGVLLHRSSTRN